MKVGQGMAKFDQQSAAEVFAKLDQRQEVCGCQARRRDALQRLLDEARDEAARKVEEA